MKWTKCHSLISCLFAFLERNEEKTILPSIIINNCKNCQFYRFSSTTMQPLITIVGPVVSSAEDEFSTIIIIRSLPVLVLMRLPVNEHVSCNVRPPTHLYCNAPVFFVRWLNNSASVLGVVVLRRYFQLCNTKWDEKRNLLSNSRR